MTKPLFFFPPPPQLSAEVLLSKAYNLQLLRRCCFEVDRVKDGFLVWVQVIVRMWSGAIKKKKYLKKGGFSLFSENSLRGLKRKFKKLQPGRGSDRAPFFTHIPSEALPDRVRSDHPAGRTVACTLSVNTTRAAFPRYLHSDCATGTVAVSGGGGVERETAERVSCSVMRTCCPGKKQREVRKLRYGAQLWLPPSSGGMTPASNAGSRERTRLAGASAAVGGRRRAEGPTGHTLHSW